MSSSGRDRDLPPSVSRVRQWKDRKKLVSSRSFPAISSCMSLRRGAFLNVSRRAARSPCSARPGIRPVDPQEIRSLRLMIDSGDP